MATGRSQGSELNAKIKEAKDSYRRKLERKLQQNNVREVWSGMRTVTGYRPTGSGVGGSVARANELNLLFNRSDIKCVYMTLKKTKLLG